MCHGAKLALPLITIKVAADEFGVGLDRMGWAITAFLIGMAASAVPAGLAGDRFGTERMLVLFFAVLSVAAASCGWAQSFSAFVAAEALLGVAAGLFHPVGLGLLSLSVESSALGDAMGRFGMMGSAGMIATPFLMNSSLGWRAGFFGLALAALVMVVVCLVLIRLGWLVDQRLRPGVGSAAKPSSTDSSAASGSVGERPGGPGFGSASAATSSAQAGAESGRVGRAIWGVSLTLALLLLAMGVNAFLGAGWETIFPETIKDTGLKVIDNQAVASGILVVGGIGQWVGGILARDAFAASRYAVILVVQSLVLLGTATAIDRAAMPFMLLGSFAFFNTMTMPLENKLLAGFTSTRRRATAFALKFLVALLIAAPAPWAAARLYAGAEDSQPVYRFLALAGMVGVFAGYFFLRATRRDALAARTPRP